MIAIRHKGSFKNTERFLKNAKTLSLEDVLKKYALEGVKALSAATPVDTGKTAASWGYEIVSNNGTTSIYWTNSNIVNGVSIALILQYGHGTRNGGYVQGRDYISPAIQPIFDSMAESAWKEVTSL